MRCSGDSASGNERRNERCAAQLLTAPPCCCNGRAMDNFDVIIVGGGHAGCEAAAVAARVGARVALVTFSRETIGAMSCNPAIGGLGKGHLVREVDAYDGLIARAADAAAIHYRMLNMSKGAAVRGPRVQADRALFARAVQTMIATHPNITVVEGEAEALTLDHDTITGLVLADGRSLTAPAVVLAAGTFLGGRLYRGEWSGAGGRTGERAATALGAQLRDLGLPVARLKTGTPPRLDGRTIDWSALVRQESDVDPWTMAPESRARRNPQLFCAITRTNEATHDIVRGGLDRSPLFSGAIDAKGPRYCPSIEDKIHRFADRDGHQIFLEPEGLATHLVYPNGISTSLPDDVQRAMIRSIAGLERTEIAVPGYAVEYDHVDPRCLDRRLGVRAIPGLFCAGQIIGTTGYEEAAALGLAAGANAAALALARDAVHFDRTTSYLGVMIDDLILQGVSEPYRMLTARAEYRLRLRADNAWTRLGKHAEAIGCLSERRQDALATHRAALGEVATLIDGDAETSSRNGERRSLGDALIQSDIAFRDARDDHPQLAACDPAALDEIESDRRYGPYLARQEAEIRALAANERIAIPADFDFAGVGGLSNEMIERLDAARPETLGMMARIPGITPAALTAVLVRLRRVAA